MLSHIDEIQGIGLHLDLVLRKIQEAYLKQFKELGVSMTIEQWVIMHQVYELGEKASQRAIVQSNFRNRATISRVIGGLERKGWIEKTRFEGDQKRYRLQLTDAGLALVEKVLPYAVALRKLAVGNLELPQFKTFMAVLNQIGDNYTADLKKN